MSIPVGATVTDVVALVNPGAEEGTPPPDIARVIERIGLLPTGAPLTDRTTSPGTSSGEISAPTMSRRPASSSGARAVCVVPLGWPSGLGLDRGSGRG